MGGRKVVCCEMKNNDAFCNVLPWDIERKYITDLRHVIPF